MIAEIPALQVLEDQVKRVDRLVHFHELNNVCMFERSQDFDFVLNRVLSFFLRSQEFFTESLDREACSSLVVCSQVDFGERAFSDLLLDGVPQVEVSSDHHLGENIEPLGVFFFVAREEVGELEVADEPDAESAGRSEVCIFGLVWVSKLYADEANLHRCAEVLLGPFLVSQSLPSYTQDTCR